jgi:hypothetical protein
MLERLKSLFAAKPPVAYQDPDFGILTLESGLWGGQALHEGRSIRFYVGGTQASPDRGLLNRLRKLINCFGVIERSAIDFLHAHGEGAQHGEFEFYSLDIMWEDKPHLYALEFALSGDEHGIWRVEFDNDQPKFVGRDD